MFNLKGGETRFLREDVIGVNDDNLTDSTLLPKGTEVTVRTRTDTEFFTRWEGYVVSAEVGEECYNALVAQHILLEEAPK